MKAHHEPTGTMIDELLHAHLHAASGRGDDDRLADISREARNAFAALTDVRKAVSLFGSARGAPVERWGSLAQTTSSALTRAGFAVITGGGPGIMAAANEAALSADGTSIGLTIDLPNQEAPNPHLSLRVPFHYFFLRKLAFVKYSCAFVCLPGGFGTIDERGRRGGRGRPVSQRPRLLGDHRRSGHPRGTRAGVSRRSLPEAGHSRVTVPTMRP
jgi:hypothetical protein